jgi:hypothetical protein
MKTMLKALVHSFNYNNAAFLYSAFPGSRRFTLLPLAIGLFIQGPSQLAGSIQPSCRFEVSAIQAAYPINTWVIWGKRRQFKETFQALHQLKQIQIAFWHFLYDNEFVMFDGSHTFMIFTIQTFSFSLLWISIWNKKNCSGCWVFISHFPQTFICK